MTDPNPSTDDILARIRGRAAGSKPASPSASPGDSPETPPAESPQETPAAAQVPPAAKPKPAPTPGNTADILAAARAKAGASAPAGKPAAGGTQAKDSSAAAKPKPATKSASGSPADIMAAIRGGGASPKAQAENPAPAPSADMAAAGTAVAPKAVKAAAADSRLSAVEMIRAVRQGGDGSEVAVAKRIALPSKPLASAGRPILVKPSVAEEPRRGFLMHCLMVLCSPILVAWASFTAAVVASTLATARFMMPNVLVEPPTRFKIGPPNDYAPGTVATKWQAQFGIWVVNSEVDGAGVIYALSTVCTHLGCTPNWLEGEQKFKCPCHGSGFYKSGVNFEGPAPRPLERFGLRLAEDGMLEVDKSIKFQKELGQWSNPACFVPVS